MCTGDQNQLDKQISRSGGKAKFARYWETLRTNRLVSRGYSFIVGGEFATIPFAPLYQIGFPKHAGFPIAFLRHDGIYRSDRAGRLRTWAGVPPPVGRARAKSKNTTGGSRPACPSSTMSSDRLFLDRDARQHCPSPLHRHVQTNMRFSTVWANGDISTLPAGGHFYFALTPIRPPLTC